MFFFFFDDEEQNSFEDVKHIDEDGTEFWYARELSKLLDYKDFRNFELTIFKAMESCKNSANEITDHFVEVTEMVPIGSNNNHTNENGEDSAVT